MKFDEYEAECDRKLVAVLHKGGQLIIQCGKDCIAFDSKGACIHNDYYTVDFWEDMAVKKFYPGDKITITF